jgi:hypothetical protein
MTQEIAKLIIATLELNPDLVLKRRIRGLPGFNLLELVTALISTSNLEECSNILGYSIDPVKKAIRDSLLVKMPERSIKFGAGGTSGRASWQFDLLKLVSYKFCHKCKTIKSLEEFADCSTSMSLDKRSECISCHTVDSAMWHEYVKQRTPRWANISNIRKIYANCPEGYQVDHIIPLKGKLVSGLHVEENLQYLTMLENILKSNKYEV